MDDALSANRRLWDERARAHYRSAFYDVEGFRRGASRLHRIELEEIGPVAGRNLLHLQCHFGLDTLSFARLGARVTGVDFSEVAIDQARQLASELRLDARFICADVLDLPASLTESFEIVYTSRGVLTWLSDLERWAAGIARGLRPGGLFYMFEEHPVAGTLDEAVPELRLEYPYFSRAEAKPYEVEGSYADRGLQFTEPFAYEWSHGLGEVLTSIAAAGLRIDFVHEFPFMSWQRMPSLVEREPGEWSLREGVSGELPLSFSLAAHRP